MVVYICTKFRKNIFDGYEVRDRTRFYTKISKECNSTNNVDEVTVLVLYTSSDGGFYLY